MKIERAYSTPNGPVQNQITWKMVRVQIKEGDKTILDGDVTVPAGWSDNAAKILAHKYFRKSGVPSRTIIAYATDRPKDIPDILCPSIAHSEASLGGEISAAQVFHRIAGHWAYSGFMNGYFDTPDDAQAFYDEMYMMLALQIGAPNSPQWFNTGLWWAYGITGEESQGGFRSIGVGAPVNKEKSPYQFPQTSACFILGLQDSLLESGGITDTLTREARIFKYGSGSGINYSTLRGKGTPLSNGGTSSGMMSFLRMFDANAGTIKSGGTTRRAARMAIVDCDHPEAEDFVKWKAREDLKVSLLTSAAKNTKGTSPIAVKALEDIASTHYEGEAYNTVSGQNANNSLRVTDEFMRAVGSETHPNGFPSKWRSLWKSTIEAAWMCGDPGLQFHDEINRWHTIPKVGAQRASNPCSEYMFIDDSSCNLASLNLEKFYNRSIDEFYYGGFAHACRMFTIALDITISMSSFPDERVAENTANYRAIGLGYANLGGLLMSIGVPYDSDRGRAIAGIITAGMHGIAWQTSNEMALEDNLGPFFDFHRHAEDVARVRKMHAIAAEDLFSSYDAGMILGDNEDAFNRLAIEVDVLWRVFSRESALVPVRNAQLTLLAPTGTISFVMDCSTTGIEPDYSLTKFKSLAGGGHMTIINGMVETSLTYMGYTPTQIGEILLYVEKTGRVDLACPHIKKEHIKVFDCANDISVSGHIDMMATVQPFLSGAISKTVNLPSTATQQDVEAAYMMAWNNNLKAIAIFRDGCKLSQPLQAVRADNTANQQEIAPEASLVGSLTVKEPINAKALSALDANLGFVQINAEGIITGINKSALQTVKSVPGTKKITPRYKLPNRRGGITQKVGINGNTLYVRTGEYSDGRIGEVFLNLGRDGSTMRHLMDSIGVLMSLGLQHGVPLKEYYDAFVDTRSEPSGMVNGSDNVKFCSSIMDYIVRELAASYMHTEGEASEHKETPPAEIPNKSVESTLVHHIESSGDTITKTTRFMSAPKYNGNACPVCASFTLRRAGTCHVCDSCGSTTGCS